MALTPKERWLREVGPVPLPAASCRSCPGCLATLGTGQAAGATSSCALHLQAALFSCSALVLLGTCGLPGGPLMPQAYGASSLKLGSAHSLVQAGVGPFKIWELPGIVASSRALVPHNNDSCP